MTTAAPSSRSHPRDPRARKTPSPFARRMRRLARAGWVPDQHGAWPMAFLPLLIGVLDSGPRLIHLPITVGWLAAFALFCIAEAWVKAPKRRRASFMPAALTWGAVAGACVLILLVTAPALLAWLPLFVPFWGLALWEVFRGSERALSARFSSILASSLLVPVASWAGRESWTDTSCSADALTSGQWPTSWTTCLRLPSWPVAPSDELSHAWTAWFFIAAYFIGTVPVVRSLIRGRDDPRWAAGAFAWHLVVLVPAVLAWTSGAVTALIPLAWVVLSVRTLALPIIQRRRGRPLAPAVIGMSEMCWSVLILIALMVRAS